MVSRRESAGSLTLAEVLAKAFPAGKSSVAAFELPIHVIPQGIEPRWILIGDPRPAARVLASWRPFKMSTRLRWSAVIAAASVGALARLPGVTTTLASIDMGYWQQRLPGFVHGGPMVLHIGNPSHTRKATLFFVARDGNANVAGKVPLRESAAQAILNEADILRQLGNADYHPSPLFHDPENGIAAQTWLEGEPAGRQLISAHMDLLARFATPEATIRISSLRDEIAADLEAADPPFDRAVLSRALDLLEDDRSLPVFLEHRDFAPWNLKRLPGGSTGAIDWEWAVPHSLPCQDIFRYFYIQDALFNGPGSVWPILNQHPLVQAYLRRFDIPAESLPALAMHYHLRAMAADWKSGNTALAEYAFGEIGKLLALRPSFVAYG